MLNFIFGWLLGDLISRKSNEKPDYIKEHEARNATLDKFIEEENKKEDKFWENERNKLIKIKNKYYESIVHASEVNMKATDLNYASDVTVCEIPTEHLVKMRKSIAATATKLYEELKMIDAELRKREVDG